MSGFPSLPNELLHAIAGYCEKRDLLTLCRVDRKMHAVCLKWIYRGIKLENLGGVVKCCKTVVLYPEMALLVREFRILCAPHYAFGAFYSTVRLAISTFQNLNTLRVESWPILRSLSDIHLPRLGDCSIPASPEMFTFLKRNSTISTLRIISGHEIESFPLQPIHMPELRDFGGPASVARCVVPRSQTYRITNQWATSDNFSDCLAACSLSKAEVMQLSNIITSWDSALLSAVAQHMSGVQALLFQNVMDDDPSQPFLQFVDVILPSLSALNHLVLYPPESLDTFAIWTDAEASDEDFATLRRWSALSPTLGGVLLPTGPVWGMYDGMWLPNFPKIASSLRTRVMDASAMVQLKWLLRAALTVPGLPAAYLQYAQFVAGVDGLRAVRQALETEGEIPDFVLLPVRGLSLVGDSHALSPQ
ncbi:hypothetical protein C8R46DRAFT_1087646 [Mycena filopes]|nr:hypothetical protein C8R46DRAFT_1087646 [Mycena filopes]